MALIGGLAVLSEDHPEDARRAGVRTGPFILIRFGTAALARFGGEESAERLTAEDG